MRAEDGGGWDLKDELRNWKSLAIIVGAQIEMEHELLNDSRER